VCWVPKGVEQSNRETAARVRVHPSACLEVLFGGGFRHRIRRGSSESMKRFWRKCSNQDVPKLFKADHQLSTADRVSSHHKRRTDLFKKPVQCGVGTRLQRPERVDAVVEDRADWWFDIQSGKAEMSMQAWQALVLLRGEFRNPRFDRPHVQDEELDHFALGTVEGAEGGRIEEHTHHCGTCQLRLKEAQVFARLLAQMECSPKRRSVREDRREPRYKAAEPATITVCHPVHSVEILGAVVNFSRSGCRVRTPEPIYDGADVLINVKRAALFGTVRYCHANAEGTFDIGLRIDRVVMAMDSNAAMDSLKSQLEVSGREEEGVATVSPAYAS
jgi:hypothetical protein